MSSRCLPTSQCYGTGRWGWRSSRQPTSPTSTGDSARGTKPKTPDRPAVQPNCPIPACLPVCAGLLYLVTDELSSREQRELGADVDAALATKPCSGHGIALDPVVETTHELLKMYDIGARPEVDDCRFLYTDGCHYAFNRRVTVDDCRSWVRDRAA